MGHVRLARVISFLGLSFCAALVTACYGEDKEREVASGYCAALGSRYRECGLLGEGRYGCQNYGDAAEACETSCIENASCAELTEMACVGRGSLPDCYARCVGLEPIDCSDGVHLAGYARCNGASECSLSEDEAGCPEVGYRCRNVDEHVPIDLICNGAPDCSDASDELPDCEVAIRCDGIALAEYFVCNGIEECLDGSDEAPDCAVLSCP